MRAPHASPRSNGIVRPRSHHRCGDDEGTGGSYADFDELNTVQELAGGAPTANLLTGLDLDEVFTCTDPAGVQALLMDARLSTVATTDGAGGVGTQYSYQPFGATTATGPASANSTQFTGRENDGTGLYYYRARYQHPTLQRFVSEDPLGFGAGDTNLYAYVFNTPTQYTDPTGEFVQAMALGCLIGGGTSAAGDLLTGRKIDWPAAGAGCVMGMFGNPGAGGAKAAARAAAKGVARRAANKAYSEAKQAPVDMANSDEARNHGG